jgi:hypothetical protein
MVDVDLRKLVNDLKGFMGVTRKRPIGDVVKAFPNLTVPTTGIQVLADFGEDAAVLSLSDDPQNQGVLLLAADGIMSSLMDADPYWAGYCSVLVNLNDIAAMGGLPLAMVDIISVQNGKILSNLVRGINDACSKFGVPIVGGHTHPDNEYNAVDVAVLGIAKHSSVIYSHTAEVGDSVIFAIDLDGSIHAKAKYAWDTTTHKPRELLRKQLMVMSELGGKQLVHAGKDISNPGTLGTLGMLLESSKMGAIIQLEQIPYPENNDLDFTHWLKMYQGCGFVVTCEPTKAEGIIDIFNTAGITAQVAGEVTKEHKLVLKHQNNVEILFDFEKEKITGI